MILEILFMAQSVLAAGNPLPANNPELINQNFNEMNQEISRTDMRNGVTVGSTTVKVSSTGIVVSTTSTGVDAGITFQDGTFMKTAGAVKPSTAAITLSIVNATGETLFSLARATIAFTGSNFPVMVCLSGNYESDCNNTVTTGFGYLVNGGYGRGQSATVGAQTVRNIAANTATAIGFCTLEPRPAAGTVSIALTVMSSLNTCLTDVPSLSDTDSAAIFSAFEIPGP